MFIYRYDPITKEYLETLEAIKDKIASKRELRDVYFVLPDTTEIKPPKVKKGEVAVFIKDKWVIKEDHRGQTLYDLSSRETKVCTEIGSVPTGYSTTVPERIDDLKTLYLQTMKTNFDVCMTNTKLQIPSTNLYFSYNSVERLKNEQTLGISMSRDDNNKIYSLTREEYSVIINYLVIYGQYMYLQKWTIENVIKKCQDVEILKTHLKDLDFKVNPKLINSIVKMSPEKRKEYFAHIASNIQ